MENEVIFGMHALGMYEGQTYTNSREAFAYWYGKGIRFFEADVATTKSGDFVMQHSFKKGKEGNLHSFH